MINLADIEFKERTKPGGDIFIRAELRIFSELCVSGVAPLRENVALNAKELLSRTIVHQIYGEVKDYMAYMERYICMCNPDPSYPIDPELSMKINKLQDRFRQLLG